MKKTLPVLLLMAIAITLASCSYEKTYFHNKNGKIKHVKARNYPAWQNVKEKGYNKRTKRIMRRWDRPYYR
jgi:hypothetical protein